MRMSLRNRKLGVRLGTAALMALVLSGCLVADQDPKLTLLHNQADPAAITLSGGRLGMLSTNGTNANGNFQHVPSWCYVLSTQQASCLSNGATHETLPTPPSWWGGPGFIWAPTVRLVNGRWLMMFSASPKPSGGVQPANCIGAATSSTWNGTYTPVNSLKWCDPADPNHVGWLDPSLFLHGGKVWLYYSKQWTIGSATGSEIVAQQLSADGLSKVGAPALILTWGEVMGLNPDSNGTHGFVENPAMVADPYNNFDLLVSVGTWDNPGYNTIEVPCFSPNSTCLPNDGGLLPLDQNSLVGTGGASLANDNSPNGNYIVFHGWPNGPFSGSRTPWVETTFCSTEHLQGCPADAASATTPTKFPPPGAIPYRVSTSVVLGPGAVTGTPDRTAHTG